MANLPPPRRPPRVFAALRYPNYRLYWFGQIVSLAGTWMQSVSQPWLVLLLGGSPIQLGIVVALQFTPAMFLAPLGGVIADRVDKRRLLMVTQSVAMLQAVIFFALTALHLIQIWEVMVLALALGMVNALDMPVRQSFAAELVRREDLMNAITLNSARLKSSASTAWMIWRVIFSVATSPSTRWRWIWTARTLTLWAAKKI